MNSANPNPTSPLHLRTPLHDWHAVHGARFRDDNGWLIPTSYSGAGGATGRLLADISACAKICLLGRGVPAATEALLGESAASKPRGVASFDAGGPALACRLAEDRLLLLASTPKSGALEERLAKGSDSAGVVRSDVTTALAGFLLATEPESVLRRLTSHDVSPRALPPGSGAETSLAGVQALLVRPPGGGQASARIYVAWDLAEYVWERLLEAGCDDGIQPVGWDELPVLGWK
jgi:heterotetrameric sarcosine oxidase gamma subunit